MKEKGRKYRVEMKKGKEEGRNEMAEGKKGEKK